MKLIIQIPCYNESSTLPATLAELPRSVPGVSRVEWLVIDDGSRDDTARVAKECGADHVVRLPHNRGLARAFAAGLDACLARGADIIVNTDADNQYNAADIPALVAPILEGRAEIVIGARPVQQIDHFSPIKKVLQRLGSWAVRVVSGTDIPDAPSGFRAFSRAAAAQLNVFGEYTYTIETIIQAGRQGLELAWVPVRVNPDLRPSRLVRSMGSYVARSLTTMLRVFVTYQPLKFFAGVGAVLLLGALTLGVRFCIHFVTGDGHGHVQSLILLAILAFAGIMALVTGLVADLVAVNRKLLQKVDLRLRHLERELLKAEPSLRGRATGTDDSQPT